MAQNKSGMKGLTFFWHFRHLNFQSHSPQYDGQVIFLRFCWNSKCPPRINFIFFVGAITLKLSQKLFKFYYHISTIWRCAGDFLRFYWNSKWRPWINFLIFCRRKKMKSDIIHISQSHYPPSVNVQVILLIFKMATTSRLLNTFSRYFSVFHTTKQCNVIK